MKKEPDRSVYFLLFAFSGFSGLIYESIWTHYLKLFLGHAAYAQTLVLAIFMGGMAIGSWVCSRYSGRWKNLLLLYAVAEGIVGLCALLFHTAFASALNFSYTAVIPQLGAPSLVTAFKWGLSAAMILPQSILLGMTFPLMSAGVLRLYPQNPGSTVGMLYFTNSIGAATGVLASGFVLIRMAGLPGTIAIAGAINILLAIIVWRLVRTSPAAVESGVIDIMPRPGFSAGYRLFLLASLVTGLASFIYEIGWIRMLSLVMGSSTHAFELMISSFIAGLALGGLWIQRRIDTIAEPVSYLARVQLVMGLLALSTLLLYENTFFVMQWIVKTLPRTDAGYSLFNLGSIGIATAIMLPTTFCAGMTLPLITVTLIRQGQGERSVGAVYAANTVGAIAGIFFAVHLGMPLLGLKGLITFGAGLDIALGIALFWSSAGNFSLRRAPAVATAGGILAVTATLLFVQLDPLKMASGVYRFGYLFLPEKHNLLYHEDGKTATVSLVKNDDGSIAINTNGKTDASVMMEKGGEPTEDEATTSLLGILPLAFNPGMRTAAVIGLGSGLTSQTLLKSPTMKSVDTVEIEKKMVDAARYFGSRVDLVFSDPRSRIFIEDAKSFFSTYNKKYDLIVSEPSNPWVSGVAGLFSDEFYGRMLNHLNDEGLFVQWIQIYEINIDLVISIIKAVSSNFSDYAVYAVHDHDVLIVARKNGSLPDYDAALLKKPVIVAELQGIGVAGVQDMEIRAIGTKKILDRFVQSFPIRANSDYYPVLDQNAARSRFLGQNAVEMTSFTHFPLPAKEILSARRPSWGVTNIQSSPYFLESRAAFTAMALRDYFLHGSFARSDKHVPEETKQQAGAVKELFRSSCGAEAQNRAVGSLFAVSMAMIPYLTPSELGEVWRTLEKGPCTASFTPRIQQLVSLFKAMSRRDTRSMSLSAKKMLEESDTMTPSTVKYIASTAILGFLGQDDREAAAEVWNTHRAFLSGDNNPDLLMQLLAAEIR